MGSHPRASAPCRQGKRITGNEDLEGPGGSHSARITRPFPQRSTSWATPMTDARSLTLALGGRRNGRSGQACCPAHPDSRPSLTLADGGNGKLLLSCKAGCAFQQVIDALRQRGLVDG